MKKIFKTVTFLEAMSLLYPNMEISHENGVEFFIVNNEKKYPTEAQKNEIKSKQLEMTLQIKKDEKKENINLLCKKSIESGFTSDALETSCKYESEEIDQLNLIGAVSSGINQPFKCSLDDGESWEYKVHTAEQLKQVISDGAIVKANYLQKATELKEQVKTANSIEDLELITWKQGAKL